MGKRGPEKQYTHRLWFRIGESLDTKWQNEADNLNTPKAAIGRIAVDEYFNNDEVVIVPFTLPGEKRVATVVQLTKEQISEINELAAQLEVSAAKIGGYAIASRYNIRPLVEKKLLVTGQSDQLNLF